MQYLFVIGFVVDPHRSERADDGAIPGLSLCRQRFKEAGFRQGPEKPGETWAFGAFKLLARLKSLRGTAFDLFGYTSERRIERALPGEYTAMVFRHLDADKPLDLPLLVALAKSAELVRGYGHIKEANVARYRQECARLENAIGQPVAQAAE